MLSTKSIASGAILAAILSFIAENEKGLASSANPL
jgi:hypothetical protein